MKKGISRLFLFAVLAAFLTAGFALNIYAGSGKGKNHQHSNNAKENGKTKKIYQEGELIVKYKKHANQGMRAAMHSARGSKTLKKLRRHNMEVLKLAPGMTVEEAVDMYNADPDVEYAEPNFLLEAVETAPNDPDFTSLWGMKNTGQTGGTAGADIQATDAWDITTGDGNVVIAVIDTGVNYLHEDLADNMWTNDAELNGVTGVDDDGNGYIDDIHGIDAINNDSDPMDDNSHGSHCSGTIGGTGNNSIGVAGVNWDVSIMGCKFLSSGGSGTMADAIECLDYVKTMKDSGVNIVATSNSWGCSGGEACYSQALYDVVYSNMESGILFIAAAGNNYRDNDQTVFYPASFEIPNIISVAATDHNDAKAGFSNWGRRSVHVGAPGVNILSTVLGNNYASYQGTSMATPHVSGLAALLKADDPSLDWRALKNLILSGGEDIASMDGITITGKRINAYGSLTCTDSPVLSAIKFPAPIVSGEAATLSALSINCAAPSGPVTVSLCGEDVATLQDDGTGPDIAAGDGVFSADWTPQNGGSDLVFTSPAGTESVQLPFTITFASVSPPAPAQIGTVVSMDLSTSGVCPTTNVEYMFEIQFPYQSSNWYEVCTWQSAASCLWNTTGELPGSYNIRAKARLVGDTNEVEALNTYELTSDMPALTIADVIGYEDDGTMTFTVTSSVSATGPVTVDYATSDGTATGGDDYVPASGTVTFNPGETSQPIVITILDDAIAEDVETFSVVLSNVSGNALILDDTGVGTIRDGKPDLTVTGVSGPANLQTGDQFQVPVTIKNIGVSRTWDNFDIAVYLSDDQTITKNDIFLGDDTIYGVIQPDGERTETFTFYVPTNFSGTYYIGAIADINDTTVESDETNNALAGNQIVFTETFADIAATSVSGPASADTEQTITVTNSVMNVGGFKSWSYHVGIYLSTDATITTSDQYMGSWYASGSTQPGEERTDNTEVTIPRNVSSGTYYIGIVADMYDDLDEPDETNNALAGNQIVITKVYPDLTMTEVSGPSSVETEQQITITNTVENQSAALATQSRIGFYLSTDNVITTSDISLGERYINHLNAGQVSSADTTVTVPGYVQSGTYYIGAVADRDDDVPESDETNNALAGNQIVVTKTYPDLIMSEVSGPASANTGEQITVTNTLKNIGPVRAVSSHIGIYLSTDNVITITDRPIGYRYVPCCLYENDESTADTTIVIPGTIQSGTYYIGAIADRYENVTESDETNNATAGNQIVITKVYPDLVMTTVSGPSSADNGDQITVTNTVRNQGPARASGSSYVAFYLSADDQITASDRFLGLRSVSSLNAGQESTSDTVLTIPSDVAQGTYYIGAIADRYFDIEESDENNNAAAGNQISIGEITGSCYQVFQGVYPGIAGTKLDNCVTCHGPGSWNVYGQAIRDEINAGASMHQGLLIVEPLDSDGDSFSNIDEINAVTYPADPSDYPQ